MQTYDRMRSLPQSRVSMSTHVILRLWGFAVADTKEAEAAARHWCARYGWDVVELIRSTGTPCPIPPRDSIALSQDTDYNAVWAIYPASGVSGRMARCPPTAVPP